MNENSDLFHELSPLNTEDSLYVIERKKSEFTFPLHYHSEFELNYIENAFGALRIVGDSVEYIDSYDLCLITGSHLEHCWKNGKCKSDSIREITIQFSSELLEEGLLGKNQFKSIREMFIKAQNGIVFPIATIIRVRSLLDSLTRNDIGFYSVINLLSLMYELSLCPDMKVLSSSSFAKSEQIYKSRRVNIVDEYIKINYSRSDFKILEVANLANMNSTSFSKFFKSHSGKHFTDYLTDIRIGHVTRLLVDSEKPISEICYECGFNNLSNFNRIFLKKKKCSPKKFRELYKKKKVIF